MNILRTVLFILPLFASNPGTADSQLTTIGWVEAVRILPENFDLQAKIDTGADNSSLDITDWNAFEHKGKQWVRFSTRNNSNVTYTFERPLERYASIKRKQSKPLKRPVVQMQLCIGDKTYQAPVNLAKRENFEFRMLIGRSFLKDRFLVDSSTTLTISPKCPARELNQSR